MALILQPTETSPGVATETKAPASMAPASGGLALLLGPVSLLAVIAGLVVAGDDGLSGREVARAVLVLAWVAAGMVLVTRQPLRRLGLLVGAAAAVAAVAYLASAGVAAGWEGTGGDLALAGRALAVGLLPALGLVLLLALPDGHLESRPRRVTAASALGLGVVLGLGLWQSEPSLPTWPIWIASLAAVAIGVPAAHRRYVASAGLTRQRLQWLGCAVAVVIEGGLVVAGLRLLAGWPSGVGLVAGSLTVLIPIALAVGASPRLVTRVDRLLVHTVSLAGLTGVVVAVYLVVVLGLGRTPDDDERRLLVLSMAAAAVAALLYLPARDRLSETANRLVYGERQPPDEVLRTFGSRLSRAIPMDELLLQLAESLRKTMALTAAEVWTGSGGRIERAVSVPDRPAVQLVLGAAEQPVVTRAGVSGNAWLAVWLPGLLEGRGDVQLRVAPVSHSGELLGLIVVERRADGDVFTEEDERVLTELARQVGLALHNVQLDSALQESLDEVRRQAEELRASRARIVATADAERRKIERNLHDGAQQHLVALAVNLRLTRDLVGDDPETAVTMLDELAVSIRETIQELRDLAHGIYPPLLMDSGLVEAMRAAAGRSPLDVDVVVEGVGRYGTEAEAAVYFCCLEALQNAAKHAPGSAVAVRLWDDAGTVRFEVIDDGPGFDAAEARRGHGFQNMSDRLGAIGGSVQWDSQPGQGTCIRGAVPPAAGSPDGISPTAGQV